MVTRIKVICDISRKVTNPSNPLISDGLMSNGILQLIFGDEHNTAGDHDCLVSRECRVLIEPRVDLVTPSVPEAGFLFT